MWKDLAPHIKRQRLVIEGIYRCKISPQVLEQYFKDLSTLIGMTIIYGPLVKDLARQINPIHAGFESIVIWAESGVSLYTWENSNFFTADIYTCKSFSVEKAVEFTKKYFDAEEIVWKEC